MNMRAFAPGVDGSPAPTLISAMIKTPSIAFVEIASCPRHHLISKCPIYLALTIELVHLTSHNNASVITHLRNTS
eukprot:m.110275 g.110275  ORF g.110275 m.110275 type:complete len:75 (-) comp15266_c0_seq1:77-301(-)